MWCRWQDVEREPTVCTILLLLDWCFQVKILWVINAVHQTWEKQLPNDTQATLALSRTESGGLYEDQPEMAEAKLTGDGETAPRKLPWHRTCNQPLARPCVI